MRRGDSFDDLAAFDVKRDEDESVNPTVQGRVSNAPYIIDTV